ncbi:MAG TPA: metallophosphatase domain-containing protein [Gemmatimonadales bacterium]|nr:metallophosphatase domain-containing protein [Gemmatimonadales bacterium]
MRLVLISDTHGLHRQMPALPAGDLLVHAGDLTAAGTLEQVAEFCSWFGGLPHSHKVVIAGNHDFAFERDATRAEALIPDGVTYLRDAGVTIEGLRMWGSPWQPWFQDWAFNLRRGPELAAKWAQIPEDVQVLVTHGPPYGVLDRTLGPPPRRVGCEALAARLPALTRLRLHLFGHIHEAYGRVERDGRTSVNASICDVAYAPVNLPVVIDL